MALLFEKQERYPQGNQEMYSDISELRDMHDLLVVMRADVGENRFCEIIEIFVLKGILSYSIPPFQQCQNEQCQNHGKMAKVNCQSIP